MQARCDEVVRRVMGDSLSAYRGVITGAPGLR